jgi:hypothetical protein
MGMPGELPEFRDWSIAAVWLLKGAVDSRDGRAWNVVLSNVSQLEAYFARIGLQLVVDEPEGLAYLRQMPEEELLAEYESLPKLFRATRLSYAQTLLCVLLRDELRRFEDEDLRNERCAVEESSLFEQWKVFFPRTEDAVKLRKEMLAALRKLEELGFVRGLHTEPACWEIRPILKARLPIAELEQLRDRLAVAIERRNGNEPTPSE